MASRLSPGAANSTQTIEIQHRKLHGVDPGIAKTVNILPDVTECLQRPEDLFPKPQRTNAQKVEGSTSQQLDDDSKYNLEFDLNGFPNVQNYVERHKLLEDLTGFVLHEPTDVRKTVFLLGKSGFGKTQLATRYAQRSKKTTHSATFFIDASTKSTLDRSFAFILQKQLWNHWPEMDLDRPQMQPSDDKSVLNLFHQWLSQPKNKKWLLIFDNASDPDLLISYLPPKGVDHGTVIITTQSSSFTGKTFREKNVPGQSRQIDVEGLSFEDGKQLLVDVAGPAYKEPDKVTGIILENLESCPCKIVQFATDVRQEKEVHTVYREIIEKTLTGMAGDNDGDKLFNIACTRLLDDLGSGSDWNRQAHKDARKLLLLFSYFHCQDIWYGLVEKGKVDPGHPDAIDNDWLSRSTQNPINFKERLKILIDRGFIALDSPVDTEEDILSARITIHERLQAFLLQNQFYDKELLRLAASCVAYSSCGDYHLREYEIRRRLMSHVDAIRQHLEEHKEYGLRAFHFDDLEPKKQVIVRQMLRDEKEELEDDFIGYVNPLAQLAYLLAWDFKTGKGLQLVENAYSSLKHLMDDCTRTRWTVLIAHLLYLDENPDTYSRALRYAQDAVDAFSRSDNNFTFRELYFAKRLEIALKSKWGSREEKVTALKDNDEVLSRVRSVLPNSVYFLDVLLDSGLILLENGLFELSHKRYSDCFESFRERLPISHRIFISLAAKVAIETVAEKDTFLKTPVTDEDKATARRLMARKAWEGFKKCLGEDDPTTITQARQLASLYDEEQDLEGCIEVRKSIVASLQRAPDSDPIDQAKELKFLAEVLWKKNSTLSEDDSDLFMEIEKSLKEAIRLIQHAKVENDEKVLALQFGMASHLCQIHRYSVALPVLQQTLSSLKSIENHSQANMNTALLQLCDVYYKLSMRGDLDDLLRIEWTEPEISSDDPSPALETLRKKVGACMDYGFAARAIPLLDKIQSYLTSLENPPQPEILENSFQIAECLEATNRIIEAEEMYNSILDSISRQPALDMQEKFLKYRVFRGLSTIYRSRGERRAAVLILDKAQEEMEGCDDKESKVVQKYVATALYDIAKLEWEIYFLEGAEPTFSASAEIRFKKVLSFQDGNGRYILEDHLIGRAFYYLGFIENFDNRTSDAEDHCLNSLVYLCKELPPILSAIDSSYHLLVRSLWETLDIPDTNKLAKLFLIMASLLARFGILDLSQTTDFSVSGLLALDWAFSKTTELGIADFALTIISELALILGVAGLALPLAHTTFLRILRTCEDLWGAENWRSQNALNLLEYIERLQYNESDNGESAYISKLGNFQRRSGDTTWDLWSDPGTSQSTNSSELLSDNKSKVLLRCGKWQLAIAQLQPELRDRLVYNPPPDTSGWPQSWTFIPKAAKMRQERIDVPLRIADAPVIIPAPKRYPTVWSSIPPKDSHAPIDPSEPLSATTIIEIFREYNFAWGFFLLLNRRLQIVVDEDFDYSAALAEKPIVFGGLRVDYVTKTLVHTSSRPTENTENNPTNSHGPNLRINSKVVSTKFKRPVLGLFGRPVETSPKKIARIGVRIRRVKGSNVGENFLTIPTHSFEKVQKPHKKSSGILSSFLRLSKRRGAGVKVFEENTRKQIGTIAKTFDVKRSYSVSGVMAPDISLIRPRNPDDILQIESPIPKLEWVSEENWSRLKGTRNQSLKILGADEIMATGIRTREAKDDCAIIGEGVFLAEAKRLPDMNNPRDIKRLSENTRSINRCLLFRVRDWSSLDQPGSGIAVYANVPGMENSALVGFVSFKQDPFDEVIKQDAFEGKDMGDDDFASEMRDGNVAFFGAWQLPSNLCEKYEIVCVTQLPEGQNNTAVK